MTLFKQLSKEQQKHITDMVSDLLILDNKMLESLKHIQNSYENHKKFLLDFEKGNYTIEQLETFLLKHKQEIS